ncbi:hypothetical protein LQ327_29105 [Actinomycetospora endophytica]|uniref:Uncharacterized protein n=1 Tax=Actinomycetospora endophytica TaxID=2291215 RepID=A0ABS8PHM4_9PSEU|nr:hypothetical protein [Actinomycetospora endophytica]MCD2197437.1 hypothetical protein [Actinomycetospora endophytica]
MAMETVLLALLGVVAVWLVIDAGRERHRLRARMDRAARRAVGDDSPMGVSASHRRSVRTPAPAARPAELNTGGVGPDSWRYWPLALPATDEFHR